MGLASEPRPGFDPFSERVGDMTPGPKAAPLGAIVIAGQVLAFAVTILLARNLAAPEFEAYAAASAVFTLLVALAPLDTEKLALRVLPPAFDTAQGSLLRACLRFATMRTAIGTALSILSALIRALTLADLSPARKAAALVGCMALPLGAATHLGQEVLTAARQARFAMVAARALVPALALVLIALALGASVSGAFAIFSWTLGWLAAALWIWRRVWVLQSDLPPDTSRAPPVSTWGLAALPLWLCRLAVGLRGQAGLIALVWLEAPPNAVGAYAAAGSIVGLLVVPIAPTNRGFARDIASHLQAGNSAAIARLHANRLRWLVPMTAGVVAVVWIGAGPILGPIQPEFAEPGTGPLRILSLAAAPTLIFALAPTELKFRDQNRLVFRVLGAAAVLQLGLLIVLIPLPGATGAALAYAAPTVLSYGLLARLGHTD